MTSARAASSELRDTARAGVAAALVALALLAFALRARARPVAPEPADRHVSVAASGALRAYGVGGFRVNEASKTALDVAFVGTPGGLVMTSDGARVEQRWTRGDERVTVVTTTDGVYWTGAFAGEADVGAGIVGDADGAARPFFAALATLDTDLAVQGTALVETPAGLGYVQCTHACQSSARCFDDRARSAASCMPSFVTCAQCLVVRP